MGWHIEIGEFCSTIGQAIEGGMGHFFMNGIDMNKNEYKRFSLLYKSFKWSAVSRGGKKCPPKLF